MTAAIASQSAATTVNTKATTTSPNSAESTAVSICVSLPWQKIISTTTPYVKKYGGEALSAIGTKLKSAITRGNICGSLTSCCVPKARQPGNDKSATGNGASTEDAACCAKCCLSNDACCLKCCLKCCVPKVTVPGIDDTKLPGYTTAPGNKKTASGAQGTSGDTSSTTSAIDYPNPFQEKLYEDTPAASVSAKRLSAAFKRRLSRVSARGAAASNRSSVIYEPTAFDPNAIKLTNSTKETSEKAKNITSELSNIAQKAANVNRTGSVFELAYNGAYELSIGFQSTPESFSEIGNEAAQASKEFRGV